MPDDRDAAPSDAAARVLDEAERHFLQHGYAGARLGAIAAALGIRTASLYHHAPGGKRELWERVVGRALARHREALRAAPGETLRERLTAMAAWFLAQPAVNVVSVAASEGGMAEPMYDALMVPVAEAVREAQGRGEARADAAPGLVAGVFVAALAGLAPARREGALPRPAAEIAADVVDLLLRGLEPG